MPQKTRGMPAHTKLHTQRSHACFKWIYLQVGATIWSVFLHEVPTRDKFTWEICVFLKYFYQLRTNWLEWIDNIVHFLASVSPPVVPMWVKKLRKCGWRERKQALVLSHLPALVLTGLSNFTLSPLDCQSSLICKMGWWTQRSPTGCKRTSVSHACGKRVLTDVTAAVGVTMPVSSLAHDSKQTPRVSVSRAGISIQHRIRTQRLSGSKPEKRRQK